MKNPWQSRQTKTFWRSQSIFRFGLRWHLFAKNYMTFYCAVDPGLSLFFLKIILCCPGAASIYDRRGTPTCPFPVTCPPTWESGKNLSSVHKWCFQISITNPDASHWNNRLLIVQVAFTDAGTNRVASTLICSPDGHSSVELAAGLKCPLRGASVNIEARLHPREHVAHLRFAAARR